MRVTPGRAIEVAILLFALIGVGQLVVWMDRTLPVTVHLRVMKVAHVRVPPGGIIRYENYFTRNQYCETHVTRWFVGSDNVRREIDPLPAAMPTDGLNRRQVSEAKIKVPKDMPAGRSKSCFQSRWQCNPLQRVWPLKGPEICIDFLTEIPSSSIMLFDDPSARRRLALEGEF